MDNSLLNTPNILIQIEKTEETHPIFFMIYLKPEALNVLEDKLNLPINVFPVKNLLESMIFSLKHVTPYSRIQEINNNWTHLKVEIYEEDIESFVNIFDKFTNSKAKFENNVITTENGAYKKLYDYYTNEIIFLLNKIINPENYYTFFLTEDENINLNKLKNEEDFLVTLDKIRLIKDLEKKLSKGVTSKIIKL